MTRRRRLLTRDQERAIRRAIRAGATRREAAHAAGISEWRLYLALREQELDIPAKRRGPRVGTKYRPRTEFVDIPEAEIYARAAELRRERWTEADHETKWNKGFRPAPSG